MRDVISTIRSDRGYKNQPIGLFDDLDRLSARDGGQSRSGWIDELTKLGPIRLDHVFPPVGQGSDFNPMLHA